MCASGELEQCVFDLAHFARRRGGIGLPGHRAVVEHRDDLGARFTEGGDLFGHLFRSAVRDDGQDRGGVDLVEEPRQRSPIGWR